MRALGPHAFGPQLLPAVRVWRFGVSPSRPVDSSDHSKRPCTARQSISCPSPFTIMFSTEWLSMVCGPGRGGHSTPDFQKFPHSSPYLQGFFSPAYTGLLLTECYFNKNNPGAPMFSSQGPLCSVHTLPTSYQLPTCRHSSCQNSITTAK